MNACPQNSRQPMRKRADNCAPGLTIKEAAAICGVSRMTVWRWRKSGSIKFHRNRVERKRLLEWIASARKC